MSVRSGQLPAVQTARPPAETRRLHSTVQSPCLQISCSRIQASNTSSLFLSVSVSAPCSVQTACSCFDKHTQLLCDRLKTKTNILSSNNPETEETSHRAHRRPETTATKQKGPNPELSRVYLQVLLQRRPATTDGLSELYYRLYTDNVLKLASNDESGELLCGGIRMRSKSRDTPTRDLVSCLTVSFCGVVIHE